jgi:hypothetical protein
VKKFEKTIIPKKRLKSYIICEINSILKFFAHLSLILCSPSISINISDKTRCKKNMLTDVNNIMFLKLGLPGLSLYMEIWASEEDIPKTSTHHRHMLY